MVLGRGEADTDGPGNLLVAAAPIGRQQNLRALKLAGGVFAAAEHRRQFIALGLAQFDPITYIDEVRLLVGGRDEFSDELKIRRALHREAGHYLAFIHTYAYMFGRPPAEADIQRHFRVSPPTVHQMIVTLELKRLHPTSTRRPQKHRNPRAARKACRFSNGSVSKRQNHCDEQLVPPDHGCDGETVSPFPQSNSQTSAGIFSVALGISVGRPLGGLEHVDVTRLRLDARFVAATLRQNGPGDPRQLIGEGGCQHVVV